MGIPVRAVPGNRRVFGPIMYGKKMFEDLVGPRYSSFDQNGVHIVLLDSIGITAGREFRGEVDAEPVAWLWADLGRAGAARPVIVMTHLPLVSAVQQIVPDPWKTPETYLVTNARAVMACFAGFNVRAVLRFGGSTGLTVSGRRRARLAGQEF